MGRAPLTELNRNVAASAPPVLPKPQDQDVSQSQKDTVLPQAAAVTGTPRGLVCEPSIVIGEGGAGGGGGANAEQDTGRKGETESKQPNALTCFLLYGDKEEEEEEEEKKEEKKEITEREAGWHIELVEEEEVPLWVTLGLYSPRELIADHNERASISSSSSSTLGLYSPQELSMGLDSPRELSVGQDSEQGDGEF